MGGVSFQFAAGENRKVESYATLKTSIVVPAMLMQWKSLNATKRFSNLTVCCLYEVSLDCVGIRSRGASGLVNEIRNLYLRLRAKVSLVDDDRFRIIHGVESSVAICLLHQFGWLRLDHDANPKPGKAANVHRIERTGSGNAMFVTTCEFGSFKTKRNSCTRSPIASYRFSVGFRELKLVHWRWRCGGFASLTGEWVFAGA